MLTLKHWKHPKLPLLRTSEEISDLYSLRAIRGKAYGFFTRFPVSEHRLGLLYIMVSIPIRSGQTSNELRLQPLNPTQHWSCWRPWWCRIPVWDSQEVDLSHLVLRKLSHLNLLGDLPVQESQEVDMPPPAQGPNSREANLPRPAWGFDFSEAVTPQSAWQSAL